jgi:hypothetical protein
MGRAEVGKREDRKNDRDKHTSNTINFHNINMFRTWGVYFTIVKDQIGHFLGSLLLIGIILVFTAPIWNDE